LRGVGREGRGRERRTEREAQERAIESTRDRESWYRNEESLV